MRPITSFAAGAAIALVVASGVAAAATTGVTGRLFGSSDASTQGADARFGGTGSASASGMPVGGMAATGTNGQAATNLPALNGGTGSAASTGGRVRTSLGASAPGANVRTSTSGSATGSALAPALAAVVGTANDVLNQATAAASSVLPFSGSGGAPIVGVDVTSNGQSVASVP
jgi:hypothetical protein